MRIALAIIFQKSADEKKKDKKYIFFNNIPKVLSKLLALAFPYLLFNSKLPFKYVYEEISLYILW